jgi:hypothetical protein
MVKNPESTVKISKWLLEEIESYLRKSKRNLIEYPSKRNFVDRAVITLLEEKGIKIKK